MPATIVVCQQPSVNRPVTIILKIKKTAAGWHIDLIATVQCCCKHATIHLEIMPACTHWTYIVQGREDPICMGTMHLGFAGMFCTKQLQLQTAHNEHIINTGKICLCGSAGYAQVITTKSLNLLRTEAPLLLYLGSVIRLVTVYIT